MGVTVLPPALERLVPTSPLVAANPGIPIGIAVALADRALRQVEQGCSFAFAELGDIGLPPVVNDADQDVLRMASPLYLASEMEQAGLLEAVDTMARLFASGGIRWDLGEAVGPLARVWRDRNRRFTAEERRAIFGQLFGAPAIPALAGGRINVEFEQNLALLAKAFGTSSDLRYRGPVGGRVAAGARQLAANITMNAAGVPRLASRELLLAVKTALLVFGVPEVQWWLGARSVWSSLDSANRRFGRGGRLPDVASHARRGRSGVTILAWLADALPSLHSATAPPPVVDAAAEWIDATVVLWERFDRRQGA